MTEEQPKPSGRRSWLLPLVIGACAALVALGGIWWYQHAKGAGPKVTHLQAATTGPPAGAEFPPEQRRQFALSFVLKVEGREMDVKVTTAGDRHTTMLLRSPSINGLLARECAGNDKVVSLLRRMGFKHLQLTNGTDTWDIDLKN
jgi:hypothetical protein